MITDKGLLWALFDAQSSTRRQILLHHASFLVRLPWPSRLPFEVDDTDVICLADNEKDRASMRHSLPVYP